MAGGDVGLDDVLEIFQALFQVELPERFSEVWMHKLGDIVDENVEFSMFRADFLNQVLHLGGVVVICDDGDALAAACGDQGGGLVDSFGAACVIVRRDFFSGIAGNAIGGGAAAGAVDGGAGFAKRKGDAAAEATGGASDEGDAVF